ncbi:MAG: Mur ligase domain-containing protein [Sodalinema sp.]|uniref:Mur ligase domain-containing protein n=1 Tax=Sodalinema sp. TaxID=3080550 RepID=UPI00396F5696
MKALGKYSSVFFIGIGGIGMSALARFFHGSGFRVAGYDRVSGPLIETLLTEGIEVLFDESIAVIPEAFTNPLLGRNPTV